MCALTATYRDTLSIERVLIHCVRMLNAELNVTSCPPPSWSENMKRKKSSGSDELLLATSLASRLCFGWTLWSLVHLRIFEIFILILFCCENFWRINCSVISVSIIQSSGQESLQQSLMIKNLYNLLKSSTTIFFFFECCQQQPNNNTKTWQKKRKPVAFKGQRSKISETMLLVCILLKVKEKVF